jgi:hypothetical protein
MLLLVRLFKGKSAGRWLLLKGAALSRRLAARTTPSPPNPPLEGEGFGARCKHTCQPVAAHESAMFGTRRCRESAASSPIRQAWLGFAASASLSIAAGCPIRQPFVEKCGHGWPLRDLRADGPAHKFNKDKAAVVADGRFGRGAQTRLNAPRLLSFCAPCGAPEEVSRRRRACSSLPECARPCLPGCAGSTAWRRAPCHDA